MWAPPAVPPSPSDEPPRSAILIVDPEVEWRRLAGAAAAQGHVPVVMLVSRGGRSAAEAEAAAAPLRDAFALILCSGGGGGSAFALAEEARTAATVARLRWVGVLPGSRAGVESADVLAALLGLRHCPLATQAARRDKAGLGDALACAGIPRAPGAPCAYAVEAWRLGRAAGYLILIRDPLAASAPGAPAAWLCRTDAQAGAAVGRALQLGEAAVAQRRRRVVLAERCVSGDAFLVGRVALPAAPCHRSGDARGGEGTGGGNSSRQLRQRCRSSNSRRQAGGCTQA